MTGYFWSNTIWYIMLLITGILSVTVAMLKSKNRKLTLAFTFAVLGLVYLCEYIIVVYFDAYSYSPKIVADSFQDIVLGNTFSQISIATTAILLITLDLSLAWYVAVAIAYYLIEVLFLHLGIYHQNWFKSFFTPIILVPLLWLIKKWYYKVASTSKGFLFYMALLFGSYAVVAHLITLPLKLLNLQVIRGYLFSDPSKDHTATGMLYVYGIINILINLNRWKVHWVWKGVVLALLFVVQYVLYLLGFINSPNGWISLVTLFFLLGSYAIVMVMNTLLSQKKNASGKV
jgi:hypothetical protein